MTITSSAYVNDVADDHEINDDLPILDDPAKIPADKGDLGA